MCLSSVDNIPPDGSIDAGLFLLKSKHGRPLSLDEIAFVCGCSRSTIWMIEKRAMYKVKKKIQDLGGVSGDISEFLSAAYSLRERVPSK